MAAQCSRVWNIHLIYPLTSSWILVFADSQFFGNCEKCCFADVQTNLWVDTCCFSGSLGVQPTECSQYMLNSTRNCRTVLHSGCTFIHFHQQSMRTQASPHPCQHLPGPLCKNYPFTLLCNEISSSNYISLTSGIFSCV